MANITEQTIKNYPFLSLVKYGGSEYIGIIQNFDDTVMSIYEYSRVSSEKMRLRFLELGENWWYESNRKLPINIFLKGDFRYFRSTLVSLNSKDVKIVAGPTVRLSEIANKRVKRKTIQLVRKPT